MTRKIKIETTLDSKGVEQGAQRASSALDGLKNAAKSAAGMLGIGIGVGSLLHGLKSASAQAAQDELVYRRLATQVNILGGSWSSVSDRVVDMTDKMQALTGFSNTEIANALQLLSVSTGSFDKAMQHLPLTLDIASAMMWDVGTAATQMTRVLSGTAGEIGEKFGGIAAEIEALGAGASRADKTRVMLEYLNRAVGGAAQENMDAYANAVKAMNNELSDLAKILGTQLNKELLPFVQLITKGSVAIESMVKAGAGASGMPQGFRDFLESAQFGIPGIGSVAMFRGLVNTLNAELPKAKEAGERNDPIAPWLESFEELMDRIGTSQLGRRDLRDIVSGRSQAEYDLMRGQVFYPVERESHERIRRGGFVPSRLPIDDPVPVPELYPGRGRLSPLSPEVIGEDAARLADLFTAHLTSGIRSAITELTRGDLKNAFKELAKSFGDAIMDEISSRAAKSLVRFGATKLLGLPV